MRRSRVSWRVVGIVLGALGPSGSSGLAQAAAPSVPDTAITTREGAAYQGVLVEQIPGDHVSIQTADGKIHTFPADQIASIHAPGSRPSGGTTAVGSLGASGVLVDLSSAQPDARLVQMSVTGNATAAANPEICGPPCGLKVPIGTYIIGGAGMVPSPPFSLGNGPAHVRITSEPITLEQKNTGIILAAGGGIGAATVGLPLWLTGVLIESAENDTVNVDSPNPSHIGSAVKWTGLVVTAVCVVAGIAGLVMYHGDTSARVDPVGP